MTAMSVIAASLLTVAGQDITVGGFDKEAPAIVVGVPSMIRQGRSVAKQCGISVTWSYGGALWAHAADLTPEKRRCIANRMGATLGVWRN